MSKFWVAIIESCITLGEYYFSRRVQEYDHHINRKCSYSSSYISCSSYTFLHYIFSCIFSQAIYLHIPGERNSQRINKKSIIFLQIFFTSLLEVPPSSHILQVFLHFVLQVLLAAHLKGLLHFFSHFFWGQSSSQSTSVNKGVSISIYVLDAVGLSGKRSKNQV